MIKKNPTQEMIFAACVCIVIAAIISIITVTEPDITELPPKATAPPAPTAPVTVWMTPHVVVQDDMIIEKPKGVFLLGAFNGRDVQLGFRHQPDSPRQGVIVWRLTE